MMTTTTLPDLITDRIATAYGGNQAAFARALGVSQSTVNAWLKGKVALPQVELRRRLARELGVPHVRLFVIAGELDEDEIGPQSPPPFAPDSPQARVMAALRTVTDDEAALIVPVVEAMVGIAHKVKNDPVALPR